MAMTQRHIKQMVTVDMLSAFVSQDSIKDDKEMAKHVEELVDISGKIVYYLIHKESAGITAKDRRKYMRHRSIVIDGVRSFWGETMEGLEWVNACLLMAEECYKLTENKNALNMLWAKICHYLDAIHERMEKEYYKHRIDEHISAGFHFGEAAWEEVGA